MAVKPFEPSGPLGNRETLVGKRRPLIATTESLKHGKNSIYYFTTILSKITYHNISQVIIYHIS